jgi:hypothetical protein
VERRANWLLIGGLAVVLAALVVAALVISGGDDEAGPTTTADPSTTTAPSTTTTASTTTSTTPLSPDDEIRRSAAQLFELRDEVLMNPDPARVIEYAVEQSPLYANDRDAIDHLVATQARHASDTGRVLGVRLEANEGGSPHVTVVIEYVEGDVVNSAGEVLQRLPAGRVAYGVSLLGSPGSWKVNDFFVLDQLLPSEMDEVIAAGVP